MGIITKVQNGVKLYIFYLLIGPAEQTGLDRFSPYSSERCASGSDSEIIEHTGLGPFRPYSRTVCLGL